MTLNTVVNIECRAFADNIEYEKRDRRGLTKFSLFIEKKGTHKKPIDPKPVVTEEVAPAPVPAPASDDLQ